MASRITHAVSVTPIYTHTNAEGPDSDVIAADFGKTFSGSGDVSSPTYGANGATATIDHSSGSMFSTPASCKGMFIRHTGLDETGAATTETLTVLFGATQIAILEAGAAIFLPSPVSSQAVTGTPSTGQIKVEYAVFV